MNVDSFWTPDAAGVPIGTGLYVIEFSDGDSVELQELYLCKRLV